MYSCTEESDGVNPLLREVLQAELTIYWTLKNQHKRKIWKSTGQSLFSKRPGFISGSRGLVLTRE